MFCFSFLKPFFEERFIRGKSLFITMAALAFLLVLVTFGYHSKMGGYTTSMSDIPKLYAIRKPAFGKGDRKFMTSLLSFNVKESRPGKEIPTSRDYLIKGVKRLTSFDPNFFLFQRAGEEGL